MAGENVVNATPTITSSMLQETIIPGVPDVTTILLGATALVIFFTPSGYYQVREKKTGKRVGPRMYHY